MTEDHTGRKPRILFVCGRNLWRSPTAERMYRNDQRLEVRSAGVRDGRGRQVSARDLQWADLVLVMEQGHKSWILGRFRDIALPEIDCLDIPDEYQFMDAELVELIRAGTEYHIEKLMRRRLDERE